MDPTPIANNFSSYVDDLSVKKQDKALIHARRARNIKAVLMDPKDTAIESAQFRYFIRCYFLTLIRFSTVAHSALGGRQYSQRFADEEGPC